MPYTVEFLKTAAEELAELPKDAQRQVLKKIEGLKQNPHPAGAKLLHGKERLYRLRAGDYRVIYSVEGRHLVILIIRIGSRKDVYESLEALSRRVLIWRQKRP